MNLYWRIILLGTVLFSSTLTAQKVSFFDGSLEEAQDQAAIDGKLYFVDFVANYCFLCKLMDETTFVDERLGEYIAKTYIPVKINVDDFDGYVWKQKYKVKVLPTILIFNSKRELLARYEESMSGSRMLEELKKYDAPANRVKTKTAPSPRPPVITSKPEPKPKPIPIPPKPKPKPKPETRNIPPPVIRSIPTPPKKKSPIPPPVVVSKPTTNGAGLYHFIVTRHPSKGFGVQIGVFAEYGNVLREAEKLQQKFNNRKIIIHISELKAKIVYKVIIGTFNARNQAIQYRETMRKQKVDGIIKDLSTLK